MTALLQVKDLHVTYPASRAGGLAVPAVRGVDLTVEENQTVAIVGESGSGKSTIARALFRLTASRQGTAHLKGRDILGAKGGELRRLRRDFQMVFQDPFASLDPSRTVGSSIAEPLRVHGVVDRRDEPARVAELLGAVGLQPHFAERYPVEFSGGQRQRIAIARALASEPALVVLDEAVSALDVSTQNLILQLLQDLRARRSLSYLFITHNLSIVRLIADQVVVLYLGKIMERGPTRSLLKQPAHPYTAALLEAAPNPRAAGRLSIRRTLGGDTPSPTRLPSGCPFHPRCGYRTELCVTTEPPLSPTTDGDVACHYPLARARPVAAGAAAT